MKSLRAGWLSFRRIHLAALIADWLSHAAVGH